MAKIVKLSELSKDFGLKAKDVIEGFKAINIEKNTGASVSDEEFEIFMQHLTSTHQIKDLEAYTTGKVTLRSAEVKKATPKAEAKPAAPKAEPKPEAKVEAKPAAPKAEPKPEVKAEAKPAAPKAEPKVEQRPAQKPEVKREAAQPQHQRRPDDRGAQMGRPQQDRRPAQQGQNQNLGAALSLVLMALVFLCTSIMNRFGGGEDEEGGVIV